MMLASMSKSFTTSDNYDVASWLTYNADELRPKMKTMLETLSNIQGGLIAYWTVKSSVVNNLKRIISQESGLGLRADELLDILEDPGVQKIIDLYYTDPILRSINNEEN